MKTLYKTLSVLFFLGTAGALIAAIWYTNWRLFFISFCCLLFSSTSASMVSMYEKKESKISTYNSFEEMFKALDKKHMDDLEEK